MLTDLELMRLHVEAEFVHDDAGQLVSMNVPDGGRAPRFFLGETVEGVLRRYRHDVPDARRRALDAASAIVKLGPPTVDTPLDPTPFEAILSHDGRVEHTSTGLAYRFPDRLPRAADARVLRDASDAALLRPLLAEWVADVTSAQPLIVLIVDGQAVAVCASVRIIPRAHEAGVETAAAFRGRGYAGAVVARWAAAVREIGAEPLYSTVWRNTASQAVARKLGLVAFGRDLHIT